MHRYFSLAGEHPVHRIGFGAMRLSGQPGNWGPYADWQAGIRLLRRAVELGVTLIDTARSYGAGWNERLIAEALAPYPAELVIATKGGIDKVGPGQIKIDGQPDTLRKQVHDALVALRVERIDLFQLHRPDPRVPLEDSIGGLRELQLQGKVRWIGVSNVNLDQLQRARCVAAIASVQNRFNRGDTSDEPLLQYCAREGIAYLPYAPFGATAHAQGAPLVDDGQSASANLHWLLERGSNVIVIPGTTSVVHLEENLRAWEAA